MGAYSAIRYKEVPHIMTQNAITEAQHNQTMMTLMKSHLQASENSILKQDSSTNGPDWDRQRNSGLAGDASIHWHISRLEQSYESREKWLSPSESAFAIRIHAMLLHWFSRLGWNCESKKTCESSIIHMLELTFKEIEKLQNEKLKYKHLSQDDSYGSELRSISRINDSAHTKSIHVSEPKKSPRYEITLETRWVVVGWCDPNSKWCDFFLQPFCRIE